MYDFEQMRQEVMDIFYEVIDKTKITQEELSVSMTIEELLDNDQSLHEEIDMHNWDEKFEEEYGYWPDEDDYRMADQVREFKQQHNIR